MASKKEVLEDQKQEAIKRGWYLDDVMAIGHAEAKLTHTDEDIVNTYVDMENTEAALEAIEKLADALNTTRDDSKESYDLRVALCEDLFDAFPNANREKICKVKHSAAIYTLVAERYHARGFDPNGEKLLVLAGKNLASVLSEALGVPRVSCIRCLNDSLHDKNA